MTLRSGLHGREDRTMVAAIFEAQMSREQAEQLAQLMDQGRATRPQGVVTASLLYEDGVGTLIAYWVDRGTLEAYLATADVPAARS